MTLTKRAALLAVGVVLCASFAWACNVPVFRYALDHWKPDKYVLTLSSETSLSEEARLVLEKLRADIDTHDWNVALKVLDIPSDSAPASSSNASTDELKLQLWYPANIANGRPVLDMPLDHEHTQQLLSSPLRDQLKKRLTDGQSAVWLFVASGDEAADNAARAELQEQIQALQATLELPKLTDDPADAIAGGPPLRVEFSVLELKKDDHQSGHCEPCC